MTAGRPRKPTALRALHGSRPDRTNKGEPMPEKAKGDPPGWLDRDGKRVWKEYAPVLLGLGLLTELDVEMCAYACSLSGAARKLQPGSADHRKVIDAAGRLWCTLGFSPSARTKVSVTPQSEDEIETFQAKSTVK